MKTKPFPILLLCALMLLCGCTKPALEPTVVKTYLAAEEAELYEKENSPEGAVLVTYHEMSDGTWVTEGDPDTEGKKFSHRVVLSGVPVNAVPGASKWSFTILCMEDKYSFDDVFLYYASMTPSKSSGFRVVEISFNAP